MNSTVDPRKVHSLDGAPSSAAQTPVTQKISPWEESIENLIALYRKIERRSFSLSAFSAYPFAIGLWSVFKFEISLVLDLFLLIPINAAILLRNLFPGRRPYKSFSWRYIKNVLLWLWRGEGPVVPFTMIEILVRSLLVTHFRRRLLFLRRRIAVEDTLSSEDRRLLHSKIDGALEHWPSHSLLSAAYTHVLPLSGPVFGIYNLLKLPFQIPAWIVFGIVAYSLAFITSAFIVKRGLFLGGSGRSSCFPGYIAESGSYADERSLFDTVGLTTREFPLDLTIGLVNLVLGMPFALAILREEAKILSHTFGGEASAMFSTGFTSGMAIQAVAFVLLCWLAWSRRTKLGRA